MNFSLSLYHMSLTCEKKKRIIKLLLKKIPHNIYSWLYKINIVEVKD